MVVVVVVVVVSDAIIQHMFMSTPTEDQLPGKLPVPGHLRVQLLATPAQLLAIEGSQKISVASVEASATPVAQKNKAFSVHRYGQRLSIALVRRKAKQH